MTIGSIIAIIVGGGLAIVVALVVVLNAKKGSNDEL